MMWAAVGVMTGALTLWGSQFIPTGPVPEFAFAWLIHWTLMLTTAAALPQRLPRSAGYLTFRVGRAEVGRYQTVGVLSFNRVLDLTRWNLSIKKARGFTGKRGGLDRLAEATWRSELGHGWCLLMALLIAAPLWFSLTGVAGWLLALAVPLHIYPIMLQRVLRWRVQQLER